MVILLQLMRADSILDLLFYQMNKLDDVMLSPWC